MNLLHLRFSDSLLSRLAWAAAARQTQRRLFADRPTGFFVRARRRSRDADIHAQRPTILRRSAAGTAIALTAAFLLYPEHVPTVGHGVRAPIIIQMEHIPETVQKTLPPPPARPVVPIAVESEEVPDSVTIEPTDLNLDAVALDLSIAGPPGAIGVSDEPMDISEIDYKPHLLTLIMPTFPEAAKKRKLKSGSSKVKLLVNKQGNVEQVDFVEGPDVFRREAISTAFRYRFRPGRHQGEVRKVWMEISIQFRYD